MLSEGTAPPSSFESGNCSLLDFKHRALYSRQLVARGMQNRRISEAENETRYSSAESKTRIFFVSLFALVYFSVQHISVLFHVSMKDSLAYTQCKTRNRLQPNLQLAITRAFLRMTHTIIYITMSGEGWLLRARMTLPLRVRTGTCIVFRFFPTNPSVLRVFCRLVARCYIMNYATVEGLNRSMNKNIALAEYIHSHTYRQTDRQTSVLIGSFLVGISPYGPFPWKRSKAVYFLSSKAGKFKNKHGPSAI